MASYVAIYTAPPAIADEAIQALVIDDGEHTTIIGDTDLADDLRDMIELVDGTDERDRLASILTGMSYCRIVGPISFVGTAASAIEPLQNLYFG